VRKEEGIHSYLVQDKATAILEVEAQVELPVFRCQTAETLLSSPRQAPFVVQVRPLERCLKRQSSA
jgi:hypothetical protein